TGGPAAGILHTCVCGNVRKGVVPVVVIEDASSIAEYEQIGEAVVVVVTHGYAHSEQTLSAYASADGDIGEGAIAVVAVKRASPRSEYDTHRSEALEQIAPGDSKDIFHERGAGRSICKICSLPQEGVP